MGGRRPRAMCRTAVGYMATRSDGERQAFPDLFRAKRFCQMGGMRGTVRVLEAGDTPAGLSSETHWCAGCDRVVRGNWMEWSDGAWLCTGCHGGPMCPSVNDEPPLRWPFLRAMEVS